MMYSIKHMILGVAVAALMLAAGQAWAGGTATVSTATKSPYGTYLVDAEGMSLYLFKADVQGEKSVCYDKCAKFWPPLLTEGEPMAAGEAMAGMLGTIERKDGSMQVTYNGWPLYYFIKDKAPGDTKGQDVHGFGGGWYLVSPQGEAIHAEASGGGSSGSDNGGGY